MNRFASRRTVLATGAALLCAAALPAFAFENKDEGVLDKEIVLGSSQPMSGTLAYMGKAVDEGIRTYFDMVNEQGGVNGRKIKLITYDDELKPAKSVANAKLLIVEQDADIALDISDEGYVIETGRVVMHGPAAALAGNEDIRRAYLGG